MRQSSYSSAYKGHLQDLEKYSWAASLIWQKKPWSDQWADLQLKTIVRSRITSQHPVLIKTSLWPLWKRCQGSWLKATYKHTQYNMRGVYLHIMAVSHDVKIMQSVCKLQTHDYITVTYHLHCGCRV